MFLFITKIFWGDVISIFQTDPKLAMLGVIGGKDLPQDADIWDAWNCGGTYGADSRDAFTIRLKQDEKLPYMEVEAVDGMLMITQYDLKWREDLDLGWDFYDISQSLEFRRKGYKVGIPFQKQPWCMHDSGYSKLNHYDEVRKRMIGEYTEAFSKPFEPHYNLEVLALEQQIFERMKVCMEQGELAQAFEIAKMVKDKKIRNTNLQYALNIVEILEEEMRAKVTDGFLSNVYTWEDMKRKYDEIKFFLRHVEYGLYEKNTEHLYERIKAELVSKMISKTAMISIINHTIVFKQAVADVVVEALF